MAESTTVRLKHPIEFGSQTIEELVFRRGRMGDLKGLALREDVIPWDSVMTIASRLCGQPTAVVERIDEEDAGAVVSLAVGFYMRSLVTGTSE
jgi:hypothetical protein